MLNAFDPEHRINETSAILKSLLEAGIIRNTTPAGKPPNCRVRITGSGTRKLLAREEQVQEEEREQEQTRGKEEREKAAQEADQKAEHKFQVRMSLLQFFLSFLGGTVSGILITNWDRVLAALREAAEIICKFLHG